MEYKFSDRVLKLKPSAIREIFKYASDPSVISLSAGNPAPEAFPTKAISEISERILTQRPIDALQYSITEGYQPLREYLTDYMNKMHGIGRDFDNTLITSGAQQVMDLAAKSLLNEGDVVICEAPSFIGSLNTFRSYNARLRGIPMDSDGMNMEELEKALKEEPNAKFIYTIPNFQNPSGITMSWAKRKQLYALAKKYSVLILEDNPYGDLRFHGEHIEAVKSLDEDGLVIYAGTFSKIISPGLRVAALVCSNEELMRKIVIGKQSTDVHTSNLNQAIIDAYLRAGILERHIQRICKSSEQGSHLDEASL